MATTTKKTVEPAETKVETTEDTKATVKETKPEVKKPRKYVNDDMIPCKSITNGLLLVDGAKSGILYRWADYGEIEEIEYRDLIYMVRSRTPWVFKPRFLIMDEELVAQLPEITDLYNTMYNTKDLKEILNLPVSELRQAIENLPAGAQDSLKGVASTMIDRGQLDSVEKIKLIDEIFGTKLLFALAQG